MPREEFDARLARCMELILELSARLTELGISTVLDCGFWSRAGRDVARSSLEAAGADVALHYLDVPEAELRRRLTIRNKSPLPGTFEITSDMFEMFLELFEPPGADEVLDSWRAV